MYIVTREKELLLRPKIPTNRIFGEDDITPRIRAFETLEGAFSGIEDGGEMLKWAVQDSDVFYIYQFFTSNFEGVITPQVLQEKGKVADATVTGEHWILFDLNTSNMVVQKVKVKDWKEQEVTYLPAPILNQDSILYENMGVVTWISELLLEDF